MKPAGPLMIEHRLIERVIALMSRELQRIKSGRDVDPVFIRAVVDFLKTYADRCHHGKEEDILFKALEPKPLSPEHRRIMEQLLREHVLGRENARRIAAALHPCEQGNRDAVREIILGLENLVTLYPKHIDTEDKHFFLPAMDYLSDAERTRMLHDFAEFDRQLIHEKYKGVVTAMEEARG